MFRFLIGIILSTLLLGCAQIGTISGGAKDERAPLLVSSSLPPFALNVSPAEINLKFDEYFELVKPTENIRLVPNDAKIEVTQNKKSLKIELIGNLKPQTTYSLYLDRAIKDATEGNDSIYRLVFSTGSQIDSNSQWVRVRNAFTGAIETGITVGLFDSLSSGRPRYTAITNADGLAKWEYIPNVSFHLKAFRDLSKNGEIEPYEPQDMLFEAQKLRASDTTLFLLSTPRDKTVKNLKVVPPGMLTGHVPFEVDLSNFRLNNSAYHLRLGLDSVAFFVHEGGANEWKLTSPQDTLMKTLTKKEMSAPLVPQTLKSPTLKNKTITLRFSDFIARIEKKEDWSLMQLSDSVNITIDSIRFLRNEILMSFKTQGLGKLKLNVPESAVWGYSENTNAKIALDLMGLSTKELSRLKVQCVNLPEPGILVLLKDQKEIERLSVVGGAAVFESLIPGEYELLYIHDKNGNGYWDPIDPSGFSKAEEVRHFRKVPKLRPNWDADLRIE